MADKECSVPSPRTGTRPPTGRFQIDEAGAAVCLPGALQQSRWEMQRAPVSKLKRPSNYKAAGQLQAWSVIKMCDYSLHAVRSRPARAGDLLITSEFAGSPTRGFSAVGEAGVAVCLSPGTELAFSGDAACHHPFAMLFPGMRFGSVGARLARFRKINQRATDTHHDALEFANGQGSSCFQAARWTDGDGAAASCEG
ncbi:hypothetical protein ACVWXO_002107 [Bradyrhizobium sp. LM2.7]